MHKWNHTWCTLFHNYIFFEFNNISQRFFPAIVCFNMPEGSRNWSIHFLLSSAFQDKTCFFHPYLIQSPREAVIAVVVREKEQKGKGEGAGENRSYTESPGVFKSVPNTGKGKRTKEEPSTLLCKGCLAGLGEEDGHDLELTTLKSTCIHLLRAKAYQWFCGILLGYCCPFSEERGKKEWKEGRKKWRGRGGRREGEMDKENKEERRERKKETN